MESLQDTGNDLKVADRKGRITLGSRYAGKHFSVREQSDGTALLVPVLIVPERDRPLTSHGLFQSFEWLEKLAPDWDGYGSLPPTPSMISAAREVLALFQASALARGMSWVHPHVGCNERGEITLEWWIDTRTLTVYVRSDERIDYLMSWGSNIETEMEEGEISRIADFVALSYWLRHGGTQSR